MLVVSALRFAFGIVDADGNWSERKSAKLQIGHQPRLPYAGACNSPRNQPAVFAGDAWLCITACPPARGIRWNGGLSSPPELGSFFRHSGRKIGTLKERRQKGGLVSRRPGKQGYHRPTIHFAPTTGSHTVIVARASVITANNKATDSKTPFSST
jgi:hypothetical protein